jgi:hypothetical protein
MPCRSARARHSAASHDFPTPGVPAMTTAGRVLPVSRLPTSSSSQVLPTRGQGWRIVRILPLASTSVDSSTGMSSWYSCRERSRRDFLTWAIGN